MKVQTVRRMLWGAVLSALIIAPAHAATKTLIFCSEGNPQGFNPQLYTSSVTFDASSRQIYNRLVEFERGTTNIVPALAESWEVSDDGLQYTFNLRKGAKFHTIKGFTPGRGFDANDVLFSFNRQWDKEHPYHNVSGGTYEYFNSLGMPELISAIEKLDRYKVRFALTRPDVTFLSKLAMDFASILSAEYAEQLRKAGQPNQLNIRPVGTGPFQLMSYQKDVMIRYKAHPGYWQGKSSLDNLVFSITPNASRRYAKLRIGECHAMAYPDPADLYAMSRDPSINVLQQPGLNISYLAFNTQKEPFNNKKVRQALSMAIFKQALVDAVYQGTGQTAKNPIPPTLWSYNEEVKAYPYDLQKARQMLAEAGYPDGFETEIWVTPIQRPYNPNIRRTAEMIQAEWIKIGVVARIVSYGWDEYLKRSQAGEHPTLLLGWSGDYADPDNFLSSPLGCEAVGGLNRAQWCYQPFEELIRKARQTSDKDERTRLYKEAQVIFKEEAPWITLAHVMISQPVREEIKDYRIDPFGRHMFYGVDLVPRPTPLEPFLEE